MRLTEAKQLAEAGNVKKQFTDLANEAAWEADDWLGRYMDFDEWEEMSRSEKKGAVEDGLEEFLSDWFSGFDGEEEERDEFQDYISDNYKKFVDIVMKKIG